MSKTARQSDIGFDAEDPRCNDGGPACEGCLMVGWCLGDYPPALLVSPDGRRVVDYDFNGAPILEGRELLLPRYDGSNRPGIKRRAQMDATPEGRTLLAAAKEHLLQCMQITPPTAAAMAARTCCSSSSFRRAADVERGGEGVEAHWVSSAP